VTTTTRHDDGAAGYWPPSFRTGPWLPVAFVLAFAIWVMVSVTLAQRLLGPDPPFVARTLWNVPSGLVQAGLALLFLRYEGVRLREIGLSKRLFRPALAAAAGFVVALNVAVAGLGVLAGNELSVGAFALYRSPPLNFSLGMLAVGGLAQYVFVAPVEELAFRGYLQNRLVALFGGSRLATAGGIVASGVAFSLVHVPVKLLIEGQPVGQLAGTFVLLALSGVLLGTVYALTRNLFLVTLLHGFGNLWPLAVDPGTGVWPNWGVVLVLYLLLIVGYRRSVAGSPGHPGPGTSG
jgi:membrane protease YdiL (CAAX protease family)